MFTPLLADAEALNLGNAIMGLTCLLTLASLAKGLWWPDRPRGDSAATLADLNEMREAISARLAAVESYSHEQTHTVRNDLNALAMKVEQRRAETQASIQETIRPLEAQLGLMALAVARIEVMMHRGHDGLSAVT